MANTHLLIPIKDIEDNKQISLSEEDIVYVPISVDDKMHSDKIAYSCLTLNRETVYGKIYSFGNHYECKLQKVTHWLKPKPLSELIAEQSKPLVNKRKIKKIACSTDEQQCRDSCEYKGHREDCPLAVEYEDKKEPADLIVILQELINGYEQWEADIISNNAFWWPHADRDVLGGKLYEDMLLLQKKRNKAKEALKQFKS